LSAQPGNSLLISPEYRAEQERLHEATNYGTASIAYAPLVSQIVNRMGVTHLLDYGCGSQVNLARHLKVDHKVTYQAYDPGVARYAKPALPAEMVACIDVLEHIEPELLENVLDDIARLAEGIVFLSVDTGPAMKTLSDGRNAHLIQQPLSWWLPKFWQRWDVQTVQVTQEHSFYVIGHAKPRIEGTDGAQII
jgi:hypothetical protein